MSTTTENTIDIYQLSRVSLNMAFSLGYVRLCDKNITHLYTTVDQKQPAKRRLLPYKPSFLEEQDQKRKMRLANRRFMEYVPAQEIELPRAPAFRSLDKKYVKGVVNRLSMPAKERFNFKFPVDKSHNDWQRADAEKKKRLRETMKKFGRQSNRRTDNVTDSVDYVEKLPPIDS